MHGNYQHQRFGGNSIHRAQITGKISPLNTINLKFIQMGLIVFVCQILWTHTIIKVH
jgi:hypothetical protein